MTGRLTDNIISRLTHILCAMCITYCILKINEAKESKILRKSKGRENTFTVYIEKYLCISELTQFKPCCPRASCTLASAEIVLIGGKEALN